MTPQSVVPNASSLVWVALFALALPMVTGCLEVDELSGCKRTSDCATGEVCNLLSGRCVPEPTPYTGDELQFQGEVDCEVDGILVLENTVRGKVGGETVNMGGGASCTNDGEKFTLLILGTLVLDDTASQVGLLLNVDADRASGGGVFSATTEPDLSADDLFSGSLFLGEDLDVAALAESGSVRLDTTPTSGRNIEVDVDVQFRPVVPQPVGASCVDNFECDYGNGVFCTPVGCSTVCESQADCDSGACVELFEGGGYCMLPCTSDGDCAEDFHCANFTDEYGVCAPSFLLGPEDTGSLGARCDTESDCAAGGLCPYFGGEQGICSTECTDICFYLGVQTECVEFSNGNLCLEVCDDSKDCPDDLLCAEYEDGTSVCVPPEAVVVE